MLSLLHPRYAPTPKTFVGVAPLNKDELSVLGRTFAHARHLVGYGLFL